LASARHALLSQRGYDVEQTGLYGIPAVRVITSDAHHGSLARAMRLLGMGSANIVTLPAGGDGALEANALHEALYASQEHATIVVLQAGDINTGAFDDFETLVGLAHDHAAWVHVDGAFGLWAAASPRFRHLTKGVGGADSWATDGHKLLNVPYDSGYAFVRDAAAHQTAMFAAAPYIPIAHDARSAMQWNPEWSRRARGFATYAALRELGRAGVAQLVDRCCANAHAIATRIGALAGAQLLWEPTFNQGLVRFIDPHGASEADHDRRTDEVTADITQHGKAFFTATTWRGRRAMRVSVCNWQTTERDVTRTVESVAHVLRQRTTAKR
jgi:glutamate/tyrosine decarboxylase-like PLP-dependent enzyme